jgi:signal transduction histidine kinase
MQCAGIGASVIIGVSGIADTQTEMGRTVFHLVPGIQLAVLVGFACAFWYNTRQVEERHPVLATSLLVLQCLVPLVGLPGDLILLTAAEIPFIVRSAKALLWLVVLDVFIAGLCLYAVLSGSFAISETVMHTGHTTGVVLSVAMLMAWSLFSFSFGYLILQLEESRKATAWANAKLEASQHLATETARMGERLRISRELHDTIGHHLTGLSINLELASELSKGAALTPINRAQLVTRILLAETRDVVHSMAREKWLDLKPAVEKLAGVIKRPACHLEIGDDLDLGPAEAHVLLRCAQEAITNSARHAHASNLRIRIAREQNRVLFHASDDGKGTAQVVRGCGLQGMQERLASLGGGLEIESAPSTGFSLRGWIPSDRSLQ